VLSACVAGSLVFCAFALSIGICVGRSFSLLGSSARRGRGRQDDNTAFAYSRGESSMSACSRGFGVLLLCVVVVVSPKSIGHAEAAGLLFASSLLLLLWVLRFALFDLRFAYSLFCFLFGCAYRF